MSVQQCLSCNGVYATVQADKSQYFHTCGPSVAATDRRNENPPSSAAADAKKMIAAGKGVQTPAKVPPELAGLVSL
jgi:hypothetical protein